MTTSFYSIVIPLVKDQSVLDIGSISHSYKRRNDYKTWNFAVLGQHASSVKGIDILAEDVALARADGHNIDVGDAETYRSEEKFDLLFAGDLIEHLSNPGKFLECSFSNLKDGGRLVLCTPNTYSFAKLARVIARRTNEPPVNPEHVCYYTPNTLGELVSRYGFKLQKVHYCDLDYANSNGSPYKRAQLALNRRLSDLAPRFSQTMIAIFAKNEATADPRG